MFYNGIKILVIASFLWSCSPETNKNTTTSPALFVTQLQLALGENNYNKIDDLLVDQQELIQILIDKEKTITYQYDTEIFTMATNDKAYSHYKKNIRNEFNAIKTENKINWQSVVLQKALYQMDSLKLNISGYLLLKDQKNKTDSIHFKAIKLNNHWFLANLF